MVSISFARKLITASLLFSLGINSVQAMLGSEKTQEPRPDTMTRILGVLKSLVEPQDPISTIPETVIQNDWPTDETLHERILGMIRNSLTKNILIGDSEGNADPGHFFVLHVPENAAGLELTAQGGSGDFDLYVKHGATPTTSSYDCRSSGNGARRSCSISNPEKGSYYVMLRGKARHWSVSVTGIYELAGTTIPSISKSPALGATDSRPKSPNI